VGSLTGAVALRSWLHYEAKRGRIWLYAGTPENLPVLVTIFDNSSENLSSADNQQERPEVLFIKAKGILNDYTPNSDHQ
jgi:hypothetical protein